MQSKDYSALVKRCANHGWEELGTQIKRIDISTFDPQQLTHNHTLEARIKESWERETAGVPSTSPIRCNNELVLCKGYTTITGVSNEVDIYLALGVTDWIHYKHTPKVDPNLRVWVIGVGGITYFTDETGKQNYIFATRSTRTTNIGGSLETPPGGFLDTARLKKGEQDGTYFREEMIREAEEELGITQKEIEGTELLGLIRIGDYKTITINCYNISYGIKIKTSEEKLKQGMRRSKKYGGEHSKYYVVPEDKLNRFCQKHGKRITPRTKATLRNLLLRHPEWINDR